MSKTVPTIMLAVLALVGGCAASTSGRLLVSATHDEFAGVTTYRQDRACADPGGVYLVIAFIHRKHGCLLRAWSGSRDMQVYVTVEGEDWKFIEWAYASGGERLPLTKIGTNVRTGYDKAIVVETVGVSLSFDRAAEIACDLRLDEDGKMLNRFWTMRLYGSGGTADIRVPRDVLGRFLMELSLHGHMQVPEYVKPFNSLPFSQGANGWCQSIES